MLKNDIDFFDYIDNFKRTANITSVLIKGEESEEHPVISFVIPTYKCKPDVLKEAIDSALNQFDFNNYEVLVIDNNPEANCSTQKLIESYNEKKIVYYKNDENIGMFGNWNRGIELSRSDWVAILHDDDIASPYFLKSCFPFLGDKSVGIIKPQNTKFSDSKELKFKEPKDLKLSKLSLIDFIWGCEIGAPTNIIYNRNVLLDRGGFNQDFFPAADYVLAIKCANNYKVYKINFSLGGYRIGQNESLNSKTMELFYLNRFYITSFIMKFYHFPDFIISLIQASLLPTVISNTNNFYNTNISFDYCKELQLKQKSILTQKIANKLFIVFRYSLALRRKVITRIRF